MPSSPIAFIVSMNTLDGDREEDPCSPIGIPAEAYIHADPAARFEKLHDGGDFSPVAKSLGAVVAEAGRHRDHRDLMPYRGRGEIVECVVAADADQVIGRHAAGVRPAQRMGAILSD